MNKKILLFIFILALFFKTRAQAPANDDCTNATLISTVPFGAACSSSVSANTLLATASLPAASCTTPDDDLWYRFTANSPSIIFRYSNARNVVTGGNATPSFALYQSNCPATTTAFFCQAVSTSGDGWRIINNLTPGTTYYLRIWSLNAGIGMSIDFCIQDVPAPPANDNCAAATPLTLLAPGGSCTSPVAATTIGATQSNPASTCTGSSNNDDIWYSFVAGHSAISIQFSNARLATSNGNANLGFAMYSEACPGTNAAMVCNANLGASNGSVTVNGLINGHTYYIRFFSLIDNNFMTFDFCLIDLIVAQNDECTNALPLSTYDLGEISIPVHATTAGGTRSANDPGCGGNENNDDVWYHFTATTASVILNVKNVSINETGVSGGTVGFAMYAGACPGSSSTFDCNTILSAGGGVRIINGLFPGTEYYLRFWSTLTGGNTVSFDFNILNAAAAVNDECVNATPISLQTLDSSCSSSMHASTTGATKSTPDPSCSNGFNDDDIWFSFVASTNAVRINFSNAASASGASGATLGFAVQKDICPAPALTLGCQPNIGTGSGTALVGGLTPGETYYLRFYSYDVNNYIEFDFCVVATELPPNDECANATALPVGSGFCTSPVIGRMRNVTTSAGFGPPACVPDATSQDLWFRATIPASGNITIQTSVITHFASDDLVMEAYSGACDALTLIACDDDGNPEPPPSQAHSRITLSGRTAGETVYLRVVKKFGLTYNEFAICAWDSTVLVPIAEGGNCVPAEPVSINAANGNNYLWVPIMDASKHIIGEINAGGSELNTVNASLFVNSSGNVRRLNGHPYLDRNVSLSPQNTGRARIRLYMRNNELQSLISADGTITGMNDLKITKTNADCGPLFAGQPVIVLQDTSGNYGADHFIEFSIPSFSGFFIDGGVAVLPLEFISFKAEKQNDQIVLNWTVVPDVTIVKFEIERSHDGNSFIRVGEKKPGQFTFIDTSPLSGTIFYRIKMMGENGRQVYSKVIAVSISATSTLSVFPNPVSKYLVIRMPVTSNVATFSLFNSSGSLLKKWQPASFSSGVYTIDLQSQPVGIYFLQVNDGRKLHRYKLIKQ